MLKQERRLFIIYAVVLVLLYLMSSTNLIIKEKKKEIYPVSVIVEDTKDEQYQNVRKGMDQAAKEYHVDINFITLYDKNDIRQQMELIEREIGDGAKAVVVTPVKKEPLLLFMEEKKMVTPIVFIGAAEGSDLLSANISMDYYKAGVLLGEAFVRGNRTEVPVYLFTEGLEYQSNTGFYQGIMDILKPAGYKTTLLSKDSEDTFRLAIEEMVYPGSGQTAIIALDSRSLENAAEVLKKSTVYQEYVTNLYGIGSTISILNALDGGVVTGVVTSNQFDAGYLSIKKAVEAIQKGSTREKVELDAFYIERDALRDKSYEKMLYPME